ncbi:MAG: DUF502 domain-containing protein [Lentisphaeria bacterium]|nr:DUF502 domain-containing protein [Lentisphaeria bacterium]
MLKKNFLAGLLVILPLILSIWLINWVFNSLTEYVPAFIAWVAPDSHLNELIKDDLFNLVARAASLVIVIVSIIVIGLFARNYLGAKVLQLWEFLIKRIPVLNVLHSGIKQMLGTVIGDGSKMFSKVVLVEYPRKGIWSIGFFTADVDERIYSKVDDDSLVSLFIPTTPNPTGGFLVMVPKNEIKELDISVSTGMQLVVSGGAVNINELEFKEKAQKSDELNSSN